MLRLAARSEIDSAGSEDRSQNSGDSDDMGGHDDVIPAYPFWSLTIIAVDVVAL